MHKRASVLRGIVAGTVAIGLTTGVVAVTTRSDASPAIGHVVSTNPADFTPNINDGAVFKTAETGGVLYAGGSFTSVTIPPGTPPPPGTTAGTVKRLRMVAFSTGNGLVSGTFAPVFNGEVWAIAISGNSLYAGGTFSTVNGIARRGLVKLDRITGAVDTRFDARLTGNVTDAVIAAGRLLIAGTSAKKMMGLSLASGGDTGYINVVFSGTVAPNAGASQVYRFAVSPAGNRLVAVGNFVGVNGLRHARVVMLNLAANATVSTWHYAPTAQMCADAGLPDYMRDVDFSPDSAYFVTVSTGFVANPGQTGLALCDAAARFETTNLAPSRPTWINYTGGDTLHSVAVTDQAVYVQGHQRWLNNPQGRDSAGPGAVERPGIGALSPSSGLALSTWNPTKDRGVGGKDLLVTGHGLWVSSDTTHIGGEVHGRIALLP
jgi:hypothetical protein